MLVGQSLVLLTLCKGYNMSLFNMDGSNKKRYIELKSPSQQQADKELENLIMMHITAALVIGFVIGYFAA